MKAVDLGSGADVRETLSTIFKEKGPCLIHSPIDIHEKVFPMVPTGASNTDMIGGESNVYA